MNWKFDAAVYFTWRRKCSGWYHPSECSCQDFLRRNSAVELRRRKLGYTNASFLILIWRSVGSTVLGKCLFHISVVLMVWFRIATSVDRKCRMLQVTCTVVINATSRSRIHCKRSSGNRLIPKMVLAECLGQNARSEFSEDSLTM